MFPQCRDKKDVSAWDLIIPFWDRNIDGHVDRPPPSYLSRYRLGFLDEGFNTDSDFYPREFPQRSELVTGN